MYHTSVKMNKKNHYLIGSDKIVLLDIFDNIQFSSVAQLYLTFCDPVHCSTQAFLSITNTWSLLKLMSIELVMPFNHLILCRPLLLLL